MAGHSQFKNIMYRKGAQDKKKSKLFSKLAREIIAAAKAGVPDPNANSRLRTAIENAKAQSLPKDNIERALKKAHGGDLTNYEQVRYEGFAPGSVALIVDALTDNRNRTVSEIRTIFSKHGGTLAATGSVGYRFERKGLIVYPAEHQSEERVFEAALVAGADNVISDKDFHEIYTAADALHEVSSSLEKTLGPPKSANLVWYAKDEVMVSEDDAKNLMALLEALEDNEDVQAVSGNYKVTDSVLEKIAG